MNNNFRKIIFIMMLCLYGMTVPAMGAKPVSKDAAADTASALDSAEAVATVTKASKDTTVVAGKGKLDSAAAVSTGGKKTGHRDTLAALDTTTVKSPVKDSLKPTMDTAKTVLKDTSAVAVKDTAVAAVEHQPDTAASSAALGSKPATASVLDQPAITAADTAKKIAPKGSTQPASTDATAIAKPGPFDKLPLSPGLKQLLNKYWVYGAIGAGVIVVGVVVGIVASGGKKATTGAPGPSEDPGIPPIDVPLPGHR